MRLTVSSLVNAETWTVLKALAISHDYSGRSWQLDAPEMLPNHVGNTLANCRGVKNPMALIGNLVDELPEGDEKTEIQMKVNFVHNARDELPQLLTLSML